MNRALILRMLMVSIVLSLFVMAAMVGCASKAKYYGPSLDRDETGRFQKTTGAAAPEAAFRSNIRDGATSTPPAAQTPQPEELWVIEKPEDRIINARRTEAEYNQHADAKQQTGSQGPPTGVQRQTEQRLRLERRQE